MITGYCHTPWGLQRLRSGIIGPHMDGFAKSLQDAGHTFFTVRGYLHAAAHLGRWAGKRGLMLVELSEEILGRFRHHLSRCRCFKNSRGTFRRTIPQVVRLFSYLRGCDAIPPARVTPAVRPFAEITDQFSTWMLRHRGLVSSTLSRYQRVLIPFFTELGEDPLAYDAKSIRAFVVKELTTQSLCGVKSTVTGLRAFLRFLVAEGRIAPGLEQCVPRVPQWRLSSLPRYLEGPQVERVLASCDVSKPLGLRDRAILLLLARLGLRAGDIVSMTIGDVDWQHATLRVTGKGRRETLLPLPQEVGDALLDYLNHGRPCTAIERLFLTVNAPARPFANPSSVSGIVDFALQRCGIEDPPSRGAHLLRHSAATAMLRAGSSLDTIAMVLRHKSPDSTAHYAKVDVQMLQQVAQPWPGGESC